MNIFSNKKNLIIAIIIVLALVFVFNSAKKDGDPNYIPGAPKEVSPVETGSEQIPDLSEDTNFAPVGSYELFSPEKIAERSQSSRVVLFFRASWCPTCRTLDKDIKANLRAIPGDITILDVDYDVYTDLKKQYGVTYQHTLVQVDKDGNIIKKWSGSSSLSKLVQQVQ